MHSAHRCYEQIDRRFVIFAIILLKNNNNLAAIYDRMTLVIIFECCYKNQLTALTWPMTQLIHYMRQHFTRPCQPTSLTANTVTLGDSTNQCLFKSCIDLAGRHIHQMLIADRQDIEAREHVRELWDRVCYRLDVYSLVITPGHQPLHYSVLCPFCYSPQRN